MPTVKVHRLVRLSFYLLFDFLINGYGAIDSRFLLDLGHKKIVLGQIFSFASYMRFFFVNVYNVFLIFYIGLNVESAELGCFELVHLLAVARARLWSIIHFH